MSFKDTSIKLNSHWDINDKIIKHPLTRTIYRYFIILFLLNSRYSRNGNVHCIDL